MISGLALIIVVSVLIALNSFFAGAEIAIISANKPLVKKRVGEDSFTAQLVDEFHANPQRMLGTYVIGSTLCATAATTLATFYFRARFGALGDFYTLFLMAFLFLIFGEIVPKIAYEEHANSVAGNSLLGLWFFSRLFYPFVGILSLIGEGASRILGGGKGEAETFFSKSELEYLLTSQRKEEELAPHERKMIRRIFRFSETTVGEVLIPLVEVKAIEDNLTVKEALDFANRWTYTRYPVFSERIDNIVGSLKTTDLLAVADPNAKVTTVIQPAVFVPETMPVDVLLARMQRENFLMAVVVDEYGGSIGIATREDILEEIIGEIRDEHEPEKPLYRQLGPNRWMVSARMEIAQINELFGWNLPRDDYATLSGLLLDRFQRIPKVGEVIRIGDFTYLVKRANPRAIIEVMVYKEEPEKPAD